MKDFHIATGGGAYQNKIKKKPIRIKKVKLEHNKIERELYIEPILDYNRIQDRRVFMRKKNAFTLIELLAVIIIIAVIALIATPIIINITGKTRKQAFERSLDGILEAVRIDYGIDGFEVPRKYFYKKGDLTLIEKGEELQNKDVGIKGKIDGQGFIYVDGDGIRIEDLCNKEYCANGKEDNIIITPNETGEVPEYELTDPTITLKGESTIYVGLKEAYREEGAIAKTIGGQVLEYTKEIRVNGEVVSNIDTSEENTYEITYKAESNEKEVSVKRTVIVLDMKPVITIIPEETKKYVSEQDILVTVSAVRPNTLTSSKVEIKKNGENLSIGAEIGKTFTLNETGEYEVKVTAIDNNNHTNTVTRTYKIDTVPPEIEFRPAVLSMKANEVSGFNFKEDETVVVTDNSEIVTWEVEGELNTTVGEQKVTYIARDEAGNETRKERVFEITDASGPVINYSSASSNNIWTRSQTITLYARIEVENDELTRFTYQVDSGTEVSVPITNNQQMDTQVILNTTGKHSIKIKAVGKYGNEKSETIGEFWIDVTAPVVGNIGGNTDTWATSKTLTSTLTDNDSKVKYYALIKDNATKPASNSTEWVSVTETMSYSFSKPITANGTYYLWAKDSVGNISEAKSVVVSKIDRDKPTAPTMNMSFGNWTAYTDNAWTNQSVYAGRTQNSLAPTGSTDGNGSGIAKYQISKDNKTWEDFNYTYSASDNMYSMHSEGTHTRYFRAVDNAGNVSAVVTKTARIDKTKPTAGTAKCNGGTCGTGWYTSDITVTAVNGSDVLSGHKSTTVSPSKITSNTSSQVITVTTTDNAGNSQTRTYTVRLDKQAPTIAIGSVGTTNITEKTSNAIPGSYFSITNPTTYSGAGTTSCIDTSNSNKVVTNTNSLSVGTHNIKCTVTRGNGLSAYLTRTFTIKSAIKTFTEIMTGSSISTSDPGGNKRYVGKTPNNYVKFNNELWRIIGIFDGQVKIIRNTSYLTETSMHGYRYNFSWCNSDLKERLNVDFWGTIDATSKTYVDQTHQWKISGGDSEHLTRKDFYNSERAQGASSCTAAVGLMYVSDFAYSTSATDANCDSATMIFWGYAQPDPQENCVKNSWLLNTGINQWTLTSFNIDAGRMNVVFDWGSVDNVHVDKTTAASGTYGARPVVYLKSTVKITGGTGTSGDPYILGT